MSAMTFRSEEAAIEYFMKIKDIGEESAAAEVEQLMGNGSIHIEPVESMETMTFRSEEEAIEHFMKLGESEEGATAEVKQLMENGSLRIDETKAGIMTFSSEEEAIEQIMKSRGVSEESAVAEVEQLMGNGSLRIDPSARPTDPQDLPKPKPIGTNVGSTEREVQNSALHHTGHITQAIGTGEYKGGAVALADKVTLQSAVNEVGNPLDPSGQKDIGQYSTLDFIATYAQTGQHSVKDLDLMAEALVDSGVAFSDTEKFLTSEGLFDTSRLDEYLDNMRNRTYVRGTVFEQHLNDILSSNTDYTAEATNLRNDVESLKSEFQNLHNNIDSWYGQATDAEKEALECILGKFEVTMGNIEDALEPACEALEKYAEYAQKTIEAEAKLDELLQIVSDIGAAEPPKTLTIPGHYSYDSKGQKEWVDGHDIPNPAYSDWQIKFASAKANADLQEQVVHDLTVKTMEYYFLKENFKTVIKSFKQFFTKKEDGGHGDWLESAEALVAHHDDIMEEFKSYVKMPVITNLSDYNVGDVIVHDDAHGRVGVVTGEFDPLSGAIQIAFYDENGKKIGDDVTVWDQREITRVGNVRDYDQEYADYPDHIDLPTEDQPDQPEQPDKPKNENQPTGGGGGGGGQPDSPDPPTGGGGGGGQPDSPDTPTDPPTDPPTEPPTIPPTIAPTIPSTTTEPQTAPQYVPGYGPNAPHTGLDAVYSAGGDTKQSSVGLGALAGLAAGAAGLGLTGLMGDKEKDKEDEDSKETVSEEKSEEQQENKTDVQEISDIPVMKIETPQGTPTNSNSVIQ